MKQTFVNWDYNTTLYATKTIILLLHSMQMVNELQALKLKSKS